MHVSIETYTCGRVFWLKTCHFFYPLAYGSELTTDVFEAYLLFFIRLFRTLQK